jgi:branched-chain amino acid transport system permease protein
MSAPATTAATAAPVTATAPQRPWRDAALTALVAFVLLLPMLGFRTVDSAGGLTLQPHLWDVAYAVAWVLIGRVLLNLLPTQPLLAVIYACSAYAVSGTLLPETYNFSSPQQSSLFPSSGMAYSYYLVGMWCFVRFVYLLASRKNIAEKFFTFFFGVLLLFTPVYVPLQTHNPLLSHAAFLITAAIVLLGLKKQFFPAGFALPSAFTQKLGAGRGASAALLLMLLAALLLPWLPFSSRYVLDVLIMVLTYAALAYGLNIVVGYAGLLDLGYVAFYAIGAYSCALLAQNAGFSFWLTLPLAGGLAALVAGLIGGPILRLRGDYLAIVTLGFAEITRLVLINAVTITGGPNGISGVPRPSLFGLEFAAKSKSGTPTFHEFFNVSFSPEQRLVFLYYLMLLLAVAIGWLGWALRRLPLGRAWEAVREDEIACAAMGINRARIRLAAYMLGALCAGLCGAFFAARQGFISPESFSFAETSTVLAIVVLGGLGHPLGILLAALFIIGLPELFRELEQYRMLAFGAGMVLIMIWRPGGLMANRLPTVTISPP